MADKQNGTGWLLDAHATDKLSASEVARQQIESAGGHTRLLALCKAALAQAALKAATGTLDPKVVTAVHILREHADALANYMALADKKAPKVRTSLASLCALYFAPTAKVDKAALEAEAAQALNVLEAGAPQK